MGTSASGGGAGGGNPLIPDFISDVGLSPEIAPSQADEQDSNPVGDTDQEREQSASSDANGGKLPSQETSGISDVATARFLLPRKQFNKYVRSGGSDTAALKKALKYYSRNAAGGTKPLARRMQPAASRVASFYRVINTVKTEGKEAALATFKLSSYSDRPVIEILSAFADVIFRDTGRIYEDTQDDSIAKQAYANTIVRISEIEQIDLGALNNEQVEVMMAIFVEETIVQRVICDIGNKFTNMNKNIDELVEIEENIYQVVSGLVRTQIMPEIIATQRGDGQGLDEKIEKIYRVAFEAMVELNN